MLRSLAWCIACITVPAAILMTGCNRSADALPGHEQAGVGQEVEPDALRGAPQGSWELSDFQTNWTLESRGSSPLDGMLWLPQIKFTVRNTGAVDINQLWLKAMFLDSDGVIKGDESITSVGAVPSGLAKGPNFLRGTLGYTSDMAFLPMIDDAKNKWRFVLYAGDSYSGPWVKIHTGSVDLPEQYKQTPSAVQDKLVGEPGQETGQIATSSGDSPPGVGATYGNGEHRGSLP